MQFEPMTEDHIDDAQALTTSFNWPHTVEDWSFAFRAGSGHIATAGGKLVGTCLTWRFGSDVSTLGLLAVASETQGQGLGRALLHRALEDHGDRTVLLHATHEAIDLYRTENFTPHDEVRQFQGVVRPSEGGESSEEVFSVDPSTAKLLPLISDLDERACGFNRGELLKALLPVSEVSVLGPMTDPTGFTLTRPFGRGLVVGPVVATTERGACALFSSALDAHVGQFVRVDVTHEFGPVASLTQRGLDEVDRVLAMSNGPLPPSAGPQKRYAMIGHAFG